MHVVFRLQVVNVTGISIGTGLSLTCDTLISQVGSSPELSLYLCNQDKHKQHSWVPRFSWNALLNISTLSFCVELFFYDQSYPCSLVGFCVFQLFSPERLSTCFTQTYGSGNLKRVGVILQRGVLILLLACFPCWAILINTEPLLLAVKQSPEVAR